MLVKTNIRDGALPPKYWGLTHSDLRRLFVKQFKADLEQGGVTLGALKPVELMNIRDVSFGVSSSHAHALSALQLSDMV